MLLAEGDGPTQVTNSKLSSSKDGACTHISNFESYSFFFSGGCDRAFINYTITVLPANREASYSICPTKTKNVSILIKFE